MATPPSGAQPADAFRLTRDALLNGDLAAFIRRAAPDIKLMTEAERTASLAAVLAEYPNQGEGVLVFAYGSLIWNPAMHITGRQLVRAQDWHRAFCLATKGGRGTPDNPGMLLGLQPGGTCVGAVLHVAEADMALELDILWRREMIAEGYIPRWIDVEAADEGNLVKPGSKAIAFTINPAGPSFCGPMPDDELAWRIATARGELGTAADYLFNTRDGLRAMGITDPLLERLGDAVTKLQTTIV